jgi:tripartite ATP-independent transporter DctM subunit
MIDLPQALAGAMFALTLALIFSGYPVAFSVGGSALIFAVIGVAGGIFELGLLNAFPERVMGILGNQVLLALPSFILMGAVLEKSRLAEDLLLSIGALFGRLRGGLALAVVLVGTLLAAATGVVGASVVSMGLISLPVMLERGYSRSLAAGVITASGTLGQIIPPSVVLVVLADQLGVSVGDLFAGALLPGLMLAGMYAAYVVGISALRPHLAPPIDVARPPAAALIAAMLPPLALVVLVLGSILVGIATPTEAGAVGAAGAALIAAARGRLRKGALWAAAEETARLCSMIMMLLIGSTLFALVFRGFDGDLMMEAALTGLPGGALGLILVTNLVLFVLGFFIDFFEICFIVLPLLVPAARLLGIDLVWFGVMAAMNLQSSFLTPPFGFSLFYLRGVAPPELQTRDIYRGVVPFVVIQLLALLLVIAFPGIVTALVPD